MGPPAVPITKTKRTRTRVRVPSARVPSNVGAQAAQADSRFDRRLQHILEHATDVFYEKGFEGASMRDLSRASGVSLAGLYHYCESKDKLLFLIQRHAFVTIVERLRERLQGHGDPVERVRIFIGNHLEYFLANMKAMKVLSHEDDVLKGEYGEQIQAIKREYYRISVGLVDDVQCPPSNGNRGGSRDSRTAVLALFGMMNWIYTWYNPRVDGDAAELASQMSELFLRGLLGARGTQTSRVSKS